jgi:hypothetical protein
MMALAVGAAGAVLPAAPAMAERGGGGGGNSRTRQEFTLVPTAAGTGLKGKARVEVRNERRGRVRERVKVNVETRLLAAGTVLDVYATTAAGLVLLGSVTLQPNRQPGEVEGELDARRNWDLGQPGITPLPDGLAASSITGFEVHDPQSSEVLLTSVPGRARGGGGGGGNDDPPGDDHGGLLGGHGGGRDDGPDHQ